MFLCDRFYDFSKLVQFDFKFRPSKRSVLKYVSIERLEFEVKLC